MADLASLVVNLVAQTAQFIDGMAQAGKAVEGLTETVNKQVDEMIEKFFSIEAAKEAFDKFAEGIKSALENLTNTAELTSVLGITAEKLSDLQYAANLHGVDNLSGGLERLARAAVSAQNGNSQMLLTFQSLGVSLADLNKNDPYDLLLKISDGVSKYADGITKTSAAQTLFGRGNAAFIQFLNQGSEGIDEAAESAKLFGQELSGDQAKAALEFTEDVRTISQIISGTFKQTLVDILPLMKSFTQSFIDFAKGTDGVKSTADKAADSITKFVTVLQALFSIVSKLNDLDAKFQDWINKITYLPPGTILSPTNGISNIAGMIVGISQALERSSLPDSVKAVNDAALAMELLGKNSDDAAANLKGFRISVEGVQDPVKIAQASLAGLFDEADRIAADTAQKVAQARKEAADLASIQSTGHPVTTPQVITTQETADNLPALGAGSVLKNLTAPFTELSSAASSAQEKIAKATTQIKIDVSTLIQQSIDANNAASLKSLQQNIKPPGSDTEKPQLKAPDTAAFEKFKTTLEAVITDYDKLNQKVSTFGLGNAAAQIYDIQFGAIGKQLDLLSSKSIDLQEKWLGDAKAQGAITNADYTKILAGLQSGVSVGEQLRQVLIKDVEQMQLLTNIDAIQKLDQALLAMTGHQKEAQAVSFETANRPLTVSLNTNAFENSLKDADAQTRANAVKAEGNSLQEQANDLIKKYQDASTLANSTDIKNQDQAIAIRAQAVAQLRTLADTLGSIGAKEGNQGLLDEAAAINKVVGSLTDENALKQAARNSDENSTLAESNRLKQEESDIQSQLNIKLAQQQDLEAHGQSELTTLANENALRAQALVQLQGIADAQGALNAKSDNPAIAKNFQDATKAAIDLHGQLDQLTKTVRDDLTNDFTNAFVEFQTGSKNAKDAFHDLITSMLNDLLRLVDKDIFESLFGSLLPGAGGAAGGVGGGAGGGLGALLASAFSGGGGSGAGTSLTAGSSSSSAGSLAGAGGIFGLLGNTVLNAFGVSSPSQLTALTKLLDLEAGPAAGLAAVNGSSLGGLGGLAQIGDLTPALGSLGADVIPTALTASDADFADILANIVGSFARGGETIAGQDYLVGEEGPELFEPADGGRPELIGLGGEQKVKALESGTITPTNLVQSRIDIISRDNKPEIPADLPTPAKEQLYRELPELAPKGNAFTQAPQVNVSVNTPEDIAPELPSLPAVNEQENLQSQVLPVSEAPPIIAPETVVPQSDALQVEASAPEAPATSEASSDIAALLFEREKESQSFQATLPTAEEQAAEIPPQPQAALPNDEASESTPVFTVPEAARIEIPGVQVLPSTENQAQPEIQTIASAESAAQEFENLPAPTEAVPSAASEPESVTIDQPNATPRDRVQTLIRNIYSTRLAEEAAVSPQVIFNEGPTPLLAALSHPLVFNPEIPPTTEDLNNGFDDEKPSLNLQPSVEKETTQPQELIPIQPEPPQANPEPLNLLPELPKPVAAETGLIAQPTFNAQAFPESAPADEVSAENKDAREPQLPLLAQPEKPPEPEMPALMQEDTPDFQPKENQSLMPNDVTLQPTDAPEEPRIPDAPLPPEIPEPPLSAQDVLAERGNDQIIVQQPPIQPKAPESAAPDNESFLSRVLSDNTPQIVVNGKTPARPPKRMSVDIETGMVSDYDAVHQLQKRVDGGDVVPNQPYLVGEDGPELMIPAAAGTIVPNDKMNAGGKGDIHVTNHFAISAPQGSASRATQNQIGQKVSMSLAMAQGAR